MDAQVTGGCQPLADAPNLALCNSVCTQSLNADPFNVHAEELALEDCTRGLEVRRSWSEREMVRSFDGRHFPGTPDGMFETWDGALTCVQVVRVPLVVELNLADMQQTLAHTVLVKVVKSQQWLHASHFVPEDFVIFCWLPFCVHSEVAQYAEERMQQVRRVDQRFSLRLRVPPQPGALFPARFASNHDVHVQKSRGGYSWSDVSTYSPSDDLSDEDEDCLWDITWRWEEDWDGSAKVPASEAEVELQFDDEFEFEWDITWDWEFDRIGDQSNLEGHGQPEGTVTVCTGNASLLSGESSDTGDFVCDNKG
mmetsp:Transcript_71555/g.173270  ORF Transcript_71555/g.173270 Transcript_71555/m.173270 type:complete len:310 (+) Transcript_71555:258-1187(+)